MDQFDNADTIYLIVADDDGGHAASIRLFPSTRPHMLGTLFQHLCPFGVPVGDTTWESTRLCLPQRHGAERRRSEEHTSELKSLMRISYAVFCLKTKIQSHMHSAYAVL